MGHLSGAITSMGGALGGNFHTSSLEQYNNNH